MRKYYEVRGWLLTAPYIIYTLVFFVIPLFWAIALAGTDWNLVSPKRNFVGLDNFITAFQSPKVAAAFVNAFKFMVLFVPLTLAISLAIALLLNSLTVWGNIFTVAFFLPYLASGVAMALVTKGLIAVNSPANKLIVSLLGFQPPWLSHPWWATMVITALIAWKFSGYYALVFLAALRSIPREMYEAAALDGAGWWTQFRKITVPMLYPAFYTVIVLAVGLMFGIFTEPYVLTGGGPNLATHTWQLEIYSQAFASFKAGYASAVAILNALATFAGVAVVRWIITRWGRAYGYEE
ncbi:MAG TPA: sugar ABC transporter permease [Symbiobacteriaceae bacterium]